MTDAKILATVSEATRHRAWTNIDWNANRRLVRNLRQRIYRASREGNHRKVRSLQRLMLKCQANRETSIRRVTQINAGRSTPGIDKVTVKTPEARTQLIAELATYQPWKAQPVRRVYIPKANGKQRPLGIPTIRDRCMQAIVKNALEPEWEAKFEPCSYGFRPGRSCHDAIERIYNNVHPATKKRWAVDADIKGAFDNIQHDTILTAIARFPGKGLIRAWLKAGLVEKERTQRTELGTPQGGVISPLLANIALHGMEKAVGVRFSKDRNSYSNRGTRALIRYADDFVILTTSKEDAEQAKSEISLWLQERGLELSEEKTKICHLTQGFDFLGFTIKLYPNPATRTGLKLLITPSKQSVLSFKQRMKLEWTKLIGQNGDTVTGRLGPIVKGWGNYFRTTVSKETFSDVDRWMFTREVRWTRRTHPEKPWKWITQTYFGQQQQGRRDKWVFGGMKGHLSKLSWTPIQRHIMVKYDASPDDSTLKEYWEKRNQRKANLHLNAQRKKLDKRQKGNCPICRDSLHNGEELHVHHMIPKRKGGSDALFNLALVHLYCHQQIHGKRLG